MKTIADIEREFDYLQKKIWRLNLGSYEIEKIKSFLSDSIKQSLEEVKPFKASHNIECPIKENKTVDIDDFCECGAEGFNECIDILDKHIQKFMEGK